MNKLNVLNRPRLAVRRPRPRGEQPLRKNPPKPPRDLKVVRQQATHFYVRAKAEEGKERFASAEHLMNKAIKNASLIDDFPDKNEMLEYQRQLSKKARAERETSESPPPPQDVSLSPA